jgi:hypothetical protein
MQYRGGLARTCLRQVRALPQAAAILTRAGSEAVETIEECNAFAWIPAAPYHELLVAIRAELGPDGNRDFWRAWVEPFVKTPLIKLAFESLRDIAKLGPGPLLGFVPKFRGLSLRNAGTLTITIDDERREAIVRVTEAPSEWWARGAQIEALVGCLHGAFDLSGVPGVITVEEADVERGRATLRMTW